MTKETLDIDIIRFQLNDFTCFRWFDPAGLLNVWGPEGAGPDLVAYVNKYGPICQHESFEPFLVSIPPFGQRNLVRKKQAMLTILVEHKEEIENGMGVSAELVQTVLDGSEPLFCLEPLE